MAIAEAPRAANAWRRISDKPTSVTFKTPLGVTLAAQVVRVESDNRASEQESAAGLGANRKQIIFGIRNHATLPDTDVAKGYTFVLTDREYRVIDVIEPPRIIGEVQAHAEAVG